MSASASVVEAIAEGAMSATISSRQAASIERIDLRGMSKLHYVAIAIVWFCCFLERPGLQGWNISFRRPDYALVLVGISAENLVSKGSFWRVVSNDRQQLSIRVVVAVNQRGINIY